MGLLMLKQVSLPDLELGMFVHKMTGSWFDHPFWKSKFLLEDPSKLRVLQESSLDGVIIDTARGKDVEQQRNVEISTRQPDPAQRLKSIRTRQSLSPKATGRQPFNQQPCRQQPSKPASTGQEVQAAHAIAENATSKMQKAFFAARLGKALNIRNVEPVVEDIHASVRRNPQAFSGLMRCKLNNEFVYRHSLSVSALMISLASQMKLSDDDIFNAGFAGLFLDLGTNYLPKDLAPDDGNFSKLDPKIWQQHVILGHRALQNDDVLSDTVLDACLHHHERFDGSGFPNALKGHEISIGGRMAAICDTFDFLLTDDGTGNAIDPAAAITRLTEMEGAFDQEILRKFIESVGRYPVGSFVRLRSDRLAMVVDENPEDFTKPVVEVFYSLKTHKRIPQRRMIFAEDMDEDEIVDVADLSELDLPDEAYLRETVFLAAYKEHRA